MKFQSFAKYNDPASVILQYQHASHPCTDLDSFVGGQTLTGFLFCLVDEGRKDPNTTISGPSSARQRNAI